MTYLDVVKVMFERLTIQEQAEMMTSTLDVLEKAGLITHTSKTLPWGR